MQDLKQLEYSPTRVRALRSELSALRNELWAVYTHREEGGYGAYYEEELDFSPRNLVFAQAALRSSVRRLLNRWAAILIVLSSYHELAEWASAVERASQETGRISPEDPDIRPLAEEIGLSLTTLNGWIRYLEEEGSWSGYARHYVRSNIVPLLLALLIGIVASVVAQILITVAAGTTLPSVRGTRTVVVARTVPRAATPAATWAVRGPTRPVAGRKA